ncbi:MAG: tetratricopeptide repeat protein, partial [Gemmatimonadetes bacterium]|nr:tetratricopeptide repeat protein [Gemmatimonadota bacterium]
VPEPEPVADLGIERSSVEFDTSGAEAGSVEGLDAGMGVESGAGAGSLDLEPASLEEPVGLGGGADASLVDASPDIMGGESGGDALSLEVPELDLAGIGEASEAGGSAGMLELDIGMGAEALAPAGPPDVGTLEVSVADDPDDPARHRALAEALMETGERERGLQELDIAMGQWESKEEWQGAQDLADEILRLDPNSIRHHQKRVEYAFRLGDKPNLINSYLELADAFFRSGAMDRARTVYERVLEHDAGNQRATLALSTLAPAPAEPAPAKKATAKPAKAAATSGEFIDLGSFILDDDDGPKDTRLRVQDEEPTGDEERDFKDMLDQFKKGIEQTVAAEDAQTHYDLGVAFKEMGLLDEGIAEFQKALSGKDMRLRASEALGACFFEKGQPAVAATVLRRAVEQDPGADEGKIGLLYWIGRCEEEQGNMGEALAHYQRVFAVDIRFQDVNERVKSLAKAGR